MGVSSKKTPIMTNTMWITQKTYLIKRVAGCFARRSQNTSHLRTMTSMASNAIASHQMKRRFLNLAQCPEKLIASLKRTVREMVPEMAPEMVPVTTKTKVDQAMRDLEKRDLDRSKEIS